MLVWKDTTTGDSLTDEKAKIILESINCSRTSYPLMVEPKSKADQDKMGIALRKYWRRSNIQVETNVETGETVISVWVSFMDVLVDRGVSWVQSGRNVGAPQVSIRNIPRFYQAQTSSGGKVNSVMYGLDLLQTKKVKDSNSKRDRRWCGSSWIYPSGWKRFGESMANGVLAGYPMVVKAELTMKHTTIDSSETAFKIAFHLLPFLKKLLSQHNQPSLEPRCCNHHCSKKTLWCYGSRNCRRGRVDGMEATVTAKSFVLMFRLLKCSRAT